MFHWYIVYMLLVSINAAVSVEKSLQIWDTV